MIKKIFAVLFFLVLIPTCLFASVSEGTAGFLSVSTEHFEIIYRPQSVKTAKLIYDNCERIYNEVSDVLDAHDVDIYLPVVITDRINILNAYYTPWPYNRIVLYDTLGQVDSLASHSDGILGIFRHELTHAIHLNIKGPFWKFLSHIIPAAMPQGLYSPPYITEGLAVMTESLKGDGRLNDKNSTQVIRQAKAENLFPSNLQASGARDIYPAGMHYIFGGAFMEWLRQTYGKEALNSFIESNGHLRFATTYGNFKKAFGLKLKDAWKNFENSVEVPDSIPYKKIGLKDGHYSVLTSNGHTVYGYDSSRYEVFKIVDGKRKTVLLHATSYPELNIISDKKILIPMVTDKESRLYFFNNGRIEHIFQNSRAGFGVKINGNDAIAVYMQKNRYSQICVYNYDYEKIAEIDLGYGVTASAFCTLENGSAAMIINSNGKDEIAILDTDSVTLKVLSNPENLKFRSLTASGNIVSFSYADDFGCYGQIKFHDNCAYLKKSSVFINGGIKYPVLIDGNVTYIAQLYDRAELCTVSLKELALSDETELEIRPYKAEMSEEPVLTDSSKYSPFRYFSSFSLIPVLGFGQSDMFDNRIGLGLSYFTSDPTETWNLITSGGWNPSKNYGFASIHVANSSIKNLQLDLKTNVTFPSFCFDVSLKAAWTKTLTHTGEYVILSDTLGLKTEKSTPLINNRFTASYSNLIKTGRKVTDYAGLEAQGDVFLYQLKQDGIEGLAGKIQVRFHPPIFIPMHSHFTFAVEGGNEHDFRLSGQITLIPLCIEIQNGFPEFYFKRFILDTSYKCTYNTVISDYKHEIAAQAYFTVSPRIGALTNVSTQLGASVAYIIGQSSVSVKPIVSFSM